MRLAFLAAPVVALAALTAACNQSDPAPVPPPETATAPVEAPVQPPAEAPVQTPAATPASSGSCLDEIGQEAATRLVERCRAVSPATRPPCNTANPCAMIQGEIDRSCALWEGQGDAPQECRPGAPQT